MIPIIQCFLGAAFTVVLFCASFALVMVGYAAFLMARSLSDDRRRWD